jgi:hypothetical protein
MVSGVLNNANTSLPDDLCETDDAQLVNKLQANTNEKFKDFKIRKFED